MRKGVTVQLRKEKAQVDLIDVSKYLKGRCKEDGARLSSLVLAATTRSRGHQVKHWRCCLNRRKHFYTVEGN